MTRRSLVLLFAIASACVTVNPATCPVPPALPAAPSFGSFGNDRMPDPLGRSLILPATPAPLPFFDGGTPFWNGGTTLELHPQDGLRLCGAWPCDLPTPTPTPTPEPRR